MIWIGGTSVTKRGVVCARHVCGRCAVACSAAGGLLIRSGSSFRVREIVLLRRLDLGLYKAIRSRMAFFFCPAKAAARQDDRGLLLVQRSRRRLGMSPAQIIFHNVTFAYETASAPLFTELTAHFQTGWTGIVGANGAGKTSLLRLATGDLSPQQGTVQEAGEAIYCPQRTDTAPPLFAEFMQASEGDAHETRGRLKIADAWLNRWATLSHGERKRAQIGVALWRQPHILAVDEPTNHLDAEARELLIGALHAFSGVGLLVSHDRELLDALCHQCLFMEPPHATMRPGSATQGTRAASQEAASIRQQAKLAKRERSRLECEAAMRREQASRAHNQRSKRGLDRKDRDARSRKNLARVTGKDGVGGKRLNQISGRLEQARQREARIAVTKTYELGIWLPGSVSRRNVLFYLPGSSLPLGPERCLHVPDLVMRPTERIALTGPKWRRKEYPRTSYRPHRGPPAATDHLYPPGN